MISSMDDRCFQSLIFKSLANKYNPIGHFQAKNLKDLLLVGYCSLYNFVTKDLF